MRILIPIVASLALLGCTPEMPAKNAKRPPGQSADMVRETYNAAHAKGREIAKASGSNLPDNAIKNKIVGGFKLVDGLNAKSIQVSVTKGIITLKGSVPSMNDRLKAEGMAYGFAGSGKKVQSLLQVVQP